MADLFESSRTYVPRRIRRSGYVSSSRHLRTAAALIRRLRRQASPVPGFPEARRAVYTEYGTTFSLAIYPDGQEFFTVTRCLPWYDVSEYCAAHDFTDAVKLFGRFLKPPTVKDLRS